MNINYIVYKTTNKINGKVYVGVHKMDLDNPDSYIGHGVTKKDKKKSVKVGFPAAVRKYGYNNFIREILFVYPDTYNGFLEAYKKEAEIVTEDWVKSNDNYNLTIGGRGGLSYTLSKPVNQYTLEGIYVKTWPSAISIESELNLSASIIRKICRTKKGICGNYQWRFYENSTVNIEAHDIKQIYQYDLQGNLIKVWKSVAEASKVFDNPASASTSILNVIHKKPRYTQAMGYYWNNKRKFEYIPPKDTKTAVACYSRDGKFIKSFTSISEAASYYKISGGNICGVIKGHHKTCNNLRWRYFYGNTSDIKPLT